MHPCYLDAKGLVACWREGLLARKVLLGETRGYTNHPQLERFRKCDEPVIAIDSYLNAICDEAEARDYSFDRTKLGPANWIFQLAVTSGQLDHELEHLRAKLELRDAARLSSLDALGNVRPHPFFYIVAGGIEDWEKLVS